MLKLFLLKRMVLNASKNIVENLQYACYVFANITVFFMFFSYMLDPHPGVFRPMKVQSIALIALCNSSMLHCLANSKR